LSDAPEAQRCPRVRAKDEQAVAAKYRSSGAPVHAVTSTHASSGPPDASVISLRVSQELHLTGTEQQMLLFGELRTEKKRAMDDETDAEISVRCSPALTAEFFYVMRGMMLATASHQELEQAPTAEEREIPARKCRALLASLDESFGRIDELLKDPGLPPNARALFAETLASQRHLFDAAKARFEAAVEVHGLGEPAGL
jgi:hypothetical protein